MKNVKPFVLILAVLLIIAISIFALYKIVIQENTNEPKNTVEFFYDGMDHVGIKSSTEKTEEYLIVIYSHNGIRSGTWNVDATPEYPASNWLDVRPTTCNGPKSKCSEIWVGEVELRAYRQNALRESGWDFYNWKEFDYDPVPLLGQATYSLK